VRLQPLTLDEVCTSLSILDDVGIVKVEGKRDMLKRTVSERCACHHPRAQHQLFTKKFELCFN
jgi:hypothetical protein